MGTTSVRRNLFSNNFNKRAAPPVPPMQGSSNNNASKLQSSTTHTTSSAETLPSSLTNPTTTTTATATTTGSSTTGGPNDSGEIVVKDKNGAYKLDIPVLSPVIVGGGGEDGDEMDGFEDSQHGGAGSGSTVVDSTGETEVGEREKERIEATLIEMMCRNRNRQMSSEPAEVYNLIQQSLRNKVASLEEDNWMYEAEVEPRA